MITFLPYADYTKSAQCLDRLRLGQQRREARDLLTIVTERDNRKLVFPIVRMWWDYRESLMLYLYEIVTEWQMRGYSDEILSQAELTTGLVASEISESGCEHPYWYDDERVYLSHRSNLLRKFPYFYKQYGWKVEPNLDYYWPEK